MDGDIDVDGAPNADSDHDAGETAEGLADEADAETYYDHGETNGADLDAADTDDVARHGRGHITIHLPEARHHEYGRITPSRPTAERSGQAADHVSGGNPPPGNIVRIIIW